MGLFETLAGGARRLFGISQDSPVRVSTPELPEPRAFVSTGDRILPYSWSENFDISPDRTSRYADFQRMDQTGFISSLLDVTVDAALTFDRTVQSSNESEMDRLESFRVEYVGSKYASSAPRKVIENTLQATGLKDQLKAICRDLLKYGDVFTEQVFDPNDQALVELVQPQTTQMRVGKDAKGRFLTTRDANGFWQAYQQLDSTGKPVAGWQPWEMVHWTLYPASSSKYSSRSMLDSMRTDHLMLKMMLEANAQARISRAMPRRVFTFDVTNKGKPEADKYIAEKLHHLFRRSSGPGAGSTDGGRVPHPGSDIVITSGYMSLDGIDRAYPRVDKVEMEDPSLAGLGIVADLEWVRQNMLSKVPKELIGVEEKTKRDVSAQDIAYGRFVKYIQSRLAVGLRQIIDTALLLQGFRNVQYRLVWPEATIATDWKWGDSQFRRSMAMANNIEEGMLSPARANVKYYNCSEDEGTAWAEESYQWKLAHPTVAGVDTDNDGKVDEPVAPTPFGAGKPPGSRLSQSGPTAQTKSPGASKKSPKTKLAQQRGGNNAA